MRTVVIIPITALAISLRIHLIGYSLSSRIAGFTIIAVTSYTAGANIIYYYFMKPRVMTAQTCHLENKITRKNKEEEIVKDNFHKAILK